MQTLLIRDEHDLIFKPKTSLVSEKHKQKRLKNKFASYSGIIEGNANRKIYDFIKLYFDLSSKNNLLTSTTNEINLQKLTSGKFSSIINLKKVNDIRYINKFFATVNTILPNSGLYLGRVITYPNRRQPC